MLAGPIFMFLVLIIPCFVLSSEGVYSLGSSPMHVLSTTLSQQRLKYYFGDLGSQHSDLC